MQSDPFRPQTSWPVRPRKTRGVGPRGPPGAQVRGSGECDGMNCYEGTKCDANMTKMTLAKLGSDELDPRKAERPWCPLAEIIYRCSAFRASDWLVDERGVRRVEEAMNLPRAVRARTRIGKYCWLLVAVLTLVLPVRGQHFDITPLIGLRTGGSIDIQDENQLQQARARLGDSATFGVAAGIRFFSEDGCEDCSVVEFRWMRQNTNLGFSGTNTPVPTPLAAFGQAPVSLDHYLADFTYEWDIPEAKAVRPFVLGSLGAARLSAPASGSTKFAFGLGAGVKIFPQRHWGIRLQVEYLPLVMHAEVQRIVCAGGCVVALGGGLLNQFEFTLGPVFRF